MPNSENLIPTNKRSKSEARKISSKGGKKSGQVRREKATIRKLLIDFLEQDAGDNAILTKLSNKLGLETKTSVKQLLVFKYMLNSIQKGGIDDLQKLVTLLGEDTGSNDIQEDDALTKALESIAKDL